MKKLFSLVLAVCLLSALCLPASAASTFDDISGTEWYAKAVLYCADNGYMSGIGGGKFDPGGKVSRAQMAQILYNFSGKPDVSGLENPFTDVGDEWYRAAIIFVKAVGVVNGTSSTTYSPNDYITREQVAVMLSNYYAKSTKTTNTADLSFLDAYTDKNTISGWAKDSVAWAIDNRIMSGTGNGKLDPKGTCTRAQLAQFIMNYCQNVGEPTPIEPEIPDNPPIILPDIPGFPEDGNFEPISEDWLPEGGYYQGGRKYNRFGIDITDVDGVPQADEIQLMAMINDYRIQNGLSKLTWSRYAQVMSEIRACEAAYIWNTEGVHDKYGTSHVRPDGSRWSKVIINEDTTTEMIPGNELMFAEIATNATQDGLNIADMDKSMTESGKIPNTNSFWYGTFGENLGQQGFGSFNLASLMFTTWVNSPGHEAAYRRNYDDTQTGYFACGMSRSKDQSGRDVYTFSYNTYGIEWMQPNEINPDDNTEWYPGKGVDYNKLDFTIDDIPDEYTDWIERELGMTIEEYGPADHTADTIKWWLRDHGIEEDSNLDVQIEAHYYSTLTMDDFIKFAISKTDWLHWAMIDADTLASSPTWEIPMYKAEVVELVADKLAYNHFVRRTDATGDYGCHVCLQDHTEKRDLAAAEEIVNQFFQDTYGFDISGY